MANCKKCHAELPEGACYCPMCEKRLTPDSRKPLKRANGTGTVYQLQGRRSHPWVAAKNRNPLGYFETKTAALEALEKANAMDTTNSVTNSTPKKTS